MALKKARRDQEPGSLSITSMMDMMTIILVFLLKSYSTTDITVKPDANLMLPASSSVATECSTSAHLFMRRRGSSAQLQAPSALDAFQTRQ